jgi:hypothetical protein
VLERNRAFVAFVAWQVTRLCRTGKLLPFAGPRLYASAGARKAGRLELSDNAEAAGDRLP